jgi:hypothetical protein
MAKRTSDADAIERRLLDLAYTTDVKITAPALAYHAGGSIDEAAAVLEDLAARERLHMDVDEDGTIIYRLPGRPPLSALPPPPPPPQPPPPVLVPAVTRELRPYRQVSPLIAMVLTLFVPGAGHVYAGRFIAGIAWFLAVSAGYALILPGLVLHLFSIGSAAGSAARENRMQRAIVGA